MTLKAEFRPLIEPAIPGVVNFFKSDEWAVRWADTDALSKLSGQGETANLSSQPFNHEITAEFQSSIGAIIPEVVNLLKHSHKGICQTGADTFLQLSEQGEDLSDSQFIACRFADSVNNS